MSKKIIYQKDTQKETGEVVTSSKVYSIKTSPEKFYMSFIENMSGFFELTSLLDVKLLSILCTRAEFNTGVVNVSPAIRKKLVEELKTSTQNISNSISRLKEKKLIEGDKGEYKINPAIFWKGSLDERSKLLEKTNNNINITVAINNFENEKTNN